MRIYKLKRILQLLLLLVKKIYLHRNLILNNSLYLYQISRKTEIKCGEDGIMVLGHIGTETNVHLVAWGGKLTIGGHCSINRNTIIVARKQIIIGRDTQIGPNVCIYDHDHAFGANGMIRDKMKYGEVKIGSNVWIGAGTIILRDTTIGDNCVIGAGCVVTGNIPPCSLVTAGNRNLKIEQLHAREIFYSDI